MNRCTERYPGPARLGACSLIAGHTGSHEVLRVSALDDWGEPAGQITCIGRWTTPIEGAMK